MKAADGMSTSQRRDEYLPAALPLASAQLPAFHIFQPSLGRREMAARAETKLAKVLLPKSEMQTEAKHQKGADGLCRRSRITIFVRHAL